MTDKCRICKEEIGKNTGDLCEICYELWQKIIKLRKSADMFEKILQDREKMK